MLVLCQFTEDKNHSCLTQNADEAANLADWDPSSPKDGCTADFPVAWFVMGV
jgi:hypothetical protein